MQPYEWFVRHLQLTTYVKSDIFATTGRVLTPWEGRVELIAAEKHLPRCSSASRGAEWQIRGKTSARTSLRGGPRRTPAATSRRQPTGSRVPADQPARPPANKTRGARAQGRPGPTRRTFEKAETQPERSLTRTGPDIDRKSTSAWPSASQQRTLGSIVLRKLFECLPATSVEAHARERPWFFPRRLLKIDSCLRL